MNRNHVSKSKRAGSRKSFVWHPGENTARAIELICEQCGMSANAVITVLAEYGLQHMQLKSRTVQEVGFSE